MSASDYKEYVMMCSNKEVSCPLCYGSFVLNSLCAHLVSEHEFKDVPLSYGYLTELVANITQRHIFELMFATNSHRGRKVIG